MQAPDFWQRAALGTPPPSPAEQAADNLPCLLIVGNSIAKPCCCPASQPEALQGKFMMSLKCFQAAGVLQHIDGVWHQLDQKSGAGGL